MIILRNTQHACDVTVAKQTCLREVGNWLVSLLMAGLPSQGCIAV